MSSKSATGEGLCIPGVLNPEERETPAFDKAVWPGRYQHSHDDIARLQESALMLI